MKHFLTVLLLIQSFVLFGQSEPVVLFGELFDLVEQHKTSDDDVVYATLQVVKEQYDQGNIEFVEKDVSESLIIGVNLDFDPAAAPGEEPLIIEIDPDLLAVYENKPSFVLSQLCYISRRAHDYFTNNALYKLTKQNDLEDFLFEMDARYVQALFIKNVLFENGYTLSEFETLLVRSNDEDQLNLYSILFLGKSRALVYEIYNLEGEKASFKKKYRELLKKSSKVFSSYKVKKSDKESDKYFKLVAYSSILTYAPQVIFDLTYQDGQVKSPKDFQWKKHAPALYRKLIALEKAMSEHKDFFISYRVSIHKKFTEDL